MWVSARNGTVSTRPARSRSVAIITRFWSQRSTNVPAIGPSSRLGSVAARKTRPVCMADPVIARTITPSAIWCSRSPKRLIVPASQKAEKRASRARRTYGCARTRWPRLTVSAGTPTSVAPTWSGGLAELSPGPIPEPMTTGRSSPARCVARQAPSWIRGLALQSETTPVSGSEEPRAMVEKRNQAMPAASSTSPRLMTLARNWDGDGQDVAQWSAGQEEVPAQVRSAVRCGRSGRGSAAVMPATSRAGRYTGM